MGKIVQTAGRNTLGEFAPEFAHFNDDVLFGENWNNAVVYKEFTHSLISCFVPQFNSLPSVITASGADDCNSLTVFPNPLPPDVAKSTIFLPLKS